MTWPTSGKYNIPIGDAPHTEIFEGLGIEAVESAIDKNVVMSQIPV
jgi:hypothetical protein